MNFEHNSKPEKFKKTFRVHKEFFESIARGAKTMELRPARDFYRRIAVGDRVIFECNQDGRNVEVEISAVREYEMLEDVRDNEDISKIAPGMDVDLAVKSAKQLFRNDIDKGFLVFEFQLCEV